MDTLGNHLPNRSSKLENFLRKNLSQPESGSIRYYEKCVAETKGALLLRHIILTDESLFVTQNPPKTLTHSIRLSKIHEINMVPDRQNLLSGGPVNNAFISQHIKITYASGPNDPKPSNKFGGNQNEVPPRIGWNIENEFSENFSSSFTLPLTLQMAYQPHLAHLEEKAEGKIPEITSGRNRSNPSNLSDTEESEIFNSSEQLPGQHGKLLREASQTSSEESSVLLSPHRSSSVLEQNLSSWRSDNTVVGEENRRPSSVDISKFPSVRRKLLGRYFTRKVQNSGSGKRIESQMGATKDAKMVQNIIIEEVNLYIYEPDSSFLNELFLYWSRQLLKSTLQMEKTVEETKENPSYGLRVAEKIFLDESRRLEVLCDSKTLQPLPFSLLFTTLCNFHKSVLRSHQFKRLCLKSQTLAATLLGVMKSCSLDNAFIKTRKWNEVPNSNIMGQTSFYLSLQERLSTNLLLFDIFRILFEYESGPLFLKSAERSNFGGSMSSPDTNRYWDSVLNTLLDNIFTFPIFPSQLSLTDRKRIQRVCSDPQTFAKLDWTKSSDAQIIQTITMGHNIAVSLLYEILSVVHYSRSDRERTAFMTLLKSFRMDNYMKQSVTQVINLLWSSRPQMTASQCVLFHRHVSVLTTLTANLSFHKGFLRQYFAEEFKYFVHEKSASMKIPDRYPIKTMLVNNFIELRNEVIRSSK